MKLWTSSILSVAVLGTFVACSSTPKPETTPVSTAAQDSAVVAVKKDTLITAKDRYSYALGMDMGRAIKNVDAEIDKELFLKSLSDQMDGNPLLMTDSQAEKALQELVLQMQVEREKKAVEAAKAALDSQNVFLEKNKSAEGVITTASGLQYKYMVKSIDSTAKSPVLTDKVRVHYTGTLLNGTEFDSSVKRGEPLEFPVGAVIQGWQELLTLMKPGEIVQAWIPSNLGYGTEGASPVIPPNALLIFQVELLNVVSAESAVDSVKVAPTKTPEEQKADSLAAVQAAKKAQADSIAAAKQAKQDSIAAAKKAKADSIAAVKKAKADSIAAVKAAKKAKQDSLAAVKKAKLDSIAAAKKAKADSIAAVKKAKADSIAAVKAAKKATADSLAAVKKAKQDSIAAAKKAKADSIAAAKKAKQDSIAAVKQAKADSIAAAKQKTKAEAEAAKKEELKPAAEPAKAQEDSLAAKK
ncbi:FKBP-type peptidyl-prolyl cis-trans isomerase [Fibrobacter intestinalis]|uniref:peptidylprolyl isomerase n=1 Tax=Fibrobacter intestinalis TaxID=28122 RepID=A0A1T4P187_9BACT|nr:MULTISPECIES: FKBP-type peptidyl-prolyl cis-trans isomerase [Fibrobacter]PBC74731.1 FKBP-type peptidyl-prolyl cis-trans isomerase [Fibrobacter sp. NR9]SJZ85162.1 FKBP-type peptidyl-prolyl cis-trans isomerase [Fibrobacter intestinalis]